MTAKRIEAVLRPASVAVVGASDTPGSIGEVLCRNLREGGFRGPVFYVNPRHATIGDAPSYPDVRSLPQTVDVAIIATPPHTLPTVL
ncbi:MAG: CoA-binding protein, partial [Steroidobacteraceae bacterium]